MPEPFPPAEHTSFFRNCGVDITVWKNLWKMCKTRARRAFQEVAALLWKKLRNNIFPKNAEPDRERAGNGRPAPAKFSSLRRVLRPARPFPAGMPRTHALPVKPAADPARRDAVRRCEEKNSMDFPTVPAAKAAEPRLMTSSPLSTASIFLKIYRDFCENQPF